MPEDTRLNLFPSECFSGRTLPRSSQYMGESPRPVRASPWEALGYGRVQRACKRLSQLVKEDTYAFDLNTASHPIPFFPERIKVIREKLVRSNRSSACLGSVYNNWTLSTIFDKSERNLISVGQLRRKCNVSEAEFTMLARNYHHLHNLQGDPDDLRTWRGAKGGDAEHRVCETKDKKVDNDYRLPGVFRAAAKGSSFVVLKDTEIVSIRLVEVASLEQLQSSLDKIFIAIRMSRKVDKGVAVPYLSRAIWIWMWLLAMVALITYVAHRGWSGLELWTMDYFEALVFSCISVPALVEYISEEPSIIRNAIRGNKVLWKNSQVRTFFNLNEFDYAVMSLLNNPMWLVSNDKASFTQLGGHPGMVGDVNVTDTGSLRRVGFYVGRVMARKEWEDSNLVVSTRSDGSVHIDRTKKSEAFLISGEGKNRPVG